MKVETCCNCDYPVRKQDEVKCRACRRTLHAECQCVESKKCFDCIGVD